MSSSSSLPVQPHGAPALPERLGGTELHPQQPQATPPSQSGLRILFNILVYLLALPSLLMWGLSYLLN